MSEEVSEARRIAVVLFNLGGPDGPKDVRPFLFNLFADPAIIGAPGPVRLGLAWFISTTRAASARANYAKMGGGSPLLPETRKQADALEQRLRDARPGDDVRVFIAMRYWRPFIADVAAEVTGWGADETVLLPLYPQFSTTTTGSALRAWRAAAPDMPTRVRCCYPVADRFIEAHARLVRETWEKAGAPANARVLFSAHGLPERTIAGGDPYQWQIEQTCAAVAARLPELPDWAV
ncbi:MAG: ferrochelatase, partial [Caulobacterales bacterium]|nr:ferrochelatase [Caulobacterales bacterium]